MYTIAGYGSMIADRVRMAAYEAALRRAVRPGCVVLDLGAGTGIMALLACRFGARHVYAVEPGDAVHAARAIAAANGLGDRITFYQELSTNLNLPERADVIVADLRGVLPLLHHHIPTLADARRRLLAPGGVLIPQRDTLWAAPVEAPEQYQRLVGVLEDGGYGFDLSAARRLVVNTWGKGRAAPGQLLGEPRCWATLDYTTRDDPDVSARVEWAPRRAGVAHGLGVWFDTTLFDDVALSNAPGEPELIYGQAFFPFAQPVAVADGDRIAAALEARLVGEDYVWTWEAQLCDAAGVGKAAQRQTSFAANPVTPAALRRRAADHVPVLDEEGELDRFILARMDGARALEAIARQTAAAFPERYPTWADALARVGELSQRYGR